MGGGETRVRNGLVIGKRHGGRGKEGVWRVVWWVGGRPVVIDPRGGSHFDGRWKAPRPRSGGLPGVLPSDGPVAGRSERPVADSWERPVADPAQALVEQNRARGVSPDGWTAGARWEREADIPDEVYFRALEALG